MQLSKQGEFWVDVLIYAAISIVLFQFGLLSILFAVPLQVLYKKRGEVSFVYAGLVFLCGALVSGFIHYRKIPAAELRRVLILFEMVLPVLMLTALYIINSSWSSGIRLLYRLLGALGTAGVLSIAIIFGFRQSQVMGTYIQDQVNAVYEFVFGPVSSQLMGVDEGMLRSIFNPEKLVETMGKLFYRTYLYSFTVTLLINWRLGEGIGSRRFGGSPHRLINFVLPEKFIWALLLPWAGIIFDIFIGLGPFAYIVWNIGLIATFLYGLQGLGIITFFLMRASVVRGLQVFIILGIVIMLFIPGFNFLLIIGIPLFGLSEVWLKYRTRKRRDEP